MEQQLLHQSQVMRRQHSKLQAHRSSFQAWKCVSLGYALLAVVLLLSKWHEAANDLKLLASIEQLIWPPANGSSPDGAWPADGAQAGAGSGGQNSSSSEQMSRHMQLAAVRELSAGQLLRQEVEAFSGEFGWRGARAN